MNDTARAIVSAVVYLAVLAYVTVFIFVVWGAV